MQLPAQCRRPVLRLPLSIVGELDRQRRQRVGQPLRASGIQRDELPHEHSERPAVGDHVMHGQQQDMLVISNPQQESPDQRTRAQAEWR